MRPAAFKINMRININPTSVSNACSQGSMFLSLRTRHREALSSPCPQKWASGNRRDSKMTCANLHGKQSIIICPGIDRVKGKMPSYASRVRKQQCPVSKEKGGRGNLIICPLPTIHATIIYCIVDMR